MKINKVNIEWLVFIIILIVSNIIFAVYWILPSLQDATISEWFIMEIFVFVLNIGLIFIFIIFQIVREWGGE